MRYRDRREAGRALAEQLRAYTGLKDGLVLALPRGGVPVGYEVARALRLPLDVFVVRKLGAPGQEELAIGAVASGGIRVLNERIITRLGLDENAIEPIAAREFEEIGRREQLYRSTKGPLNVEGKTVILVDDGIATGASMNVAVQALRAGSPKKIVVAVPVAAVENCELLRSQANDVICGETPRDFSAVGQWYEDFRQTTDEEVAELLGTRDKG
jgi:predicted phosphoribosyltransferase